MSRTMEQHKVLRARRLRAGGTKCIACGGIGYVYWKDGRTEKMPDGSTFYFGRWIRCDRCDETGVSTGNAGGGDSAAGDLKQGEST